MTNKPIDDYRKALSNPGQSYWLTRAIGENLSRDPVDAYRDCEALLDIMRARYEAIIAQAFRK
ncbi:MAG: hypothetical protein CMM40_22565 [Rhodospirillaceae bacterium]|nr:hypothetical protein [Rhodospirillaceae bacterium]|tara:strand:- start:470 stop:658 length:189 start_codon:yes stop_codon:yes gene_type:complete